jgi:hypothetical protein
MSTCDDSNAERGSLGAPLVLLGLWLRNHLDPQEVEDYLF